MLWVWIEKSISSQIIHHKSRLLSIFGIKANLFRSKPHNLQWKLRSMMLPSKITSTHSYINIIIVCVEWKFNLLACGLDSGCNMCARHIHTHTHRITHEHNSGVAAAIKHISIHCTYIDWLLMAIANRRRLLQSPTRAHLHGRRRR